MMLAGEEVLSLVVETEALLEELPEDAPDRVLISVELVNLKRIHRQLTEASDVKADDLASSGDTMADARLLISSARTQLDRASGES